jgi:hypothetical protein
MAKKKREVPKPKSVIGNSSVKDISHEYAEVLRLRQAVRQAEMRSKTSTPAASSSRQKG